MYISWGWMSQLGVPCPPYIVWG
uniref:Uncharacterized protein n=1 Tax=Arundo donax TaxID=35708 RepID=A0A0A8ZJV9_ARUDO